MQAVSNNFRNMLLRNLTLLSSIAIVILLCITNTNCANIVPPVGGTKDTIAPLLVKATPTINSLNVNTKTITMVFNEYVTLEDAFNKISIQPLPILPPNITSKLKTVTIKLKDTLLQNTTYTIGINGAIKDVNEGNKLTDFNYTFSTGNYIDSGKLQGRVSLAETGGIDSTLIVILHTNLTDSAVYKTKPLYMAKLSGTGTFTFTNLPTNTYAIYALSNEGNQKKYQSLAQLFAYNNVTVNPKLNTDSSINLYAYVQEKDVPKPPTASVAANALKDKYKVTTNLQSGEYDILQPLVLTYSQKLSKIDTTLIQLTDTVGNTIAGRIIVVDSTLKKISIRASWQLGTKYKLILPKGYATLANNTNPPKTDTIKFITKQAVDYGKVIIRFNNLNLSQHNVLQLVQNDNIMVSYKITQLKFTIPLLTPGQYTLRLLNDVNNDGVWTPGSFFTKRKQPEIITLIPKQLDVRGDWDNELEIE